MIFITPQLPSKNRAAVFRYILLFAALLLYGVGLRAQHIEVLHRQGGVSFRGLSVVSDQVIWVSGDRGTVGRSVDGGANWKWMKVAGFEERDFRDVEAFDEKTALIMAVGEPGLILKTVDGGQRWEKVYENAQPGVFLNAMAFRDPQRGMVLGDPVGGRFFLAATSDGGSSWRQLPASRLPAADTGEYCFAASGTNLVLTGKDEICFVSGGSRARLFRGEGAVRDSGLALPLLLQGGGSQGANSITVWASRGRPLQLTIVGGDYREPLLRRQNCVVSRDGGKTWIRPSNPPYGYRSCVLYITASKLITCGLNGVDISLDEGINWNSISALSFNTCARAPKSETVFLAGHEGLIGRLVW